MATNRELLEQAEALGKQLGVGVTTQGLSSAALADLVTDLQKKAATASEKPRANPPAKAASARPDFSVAPGHSIAVGRGVIAEGAPIGEHDVGGTDRLERLVALGRVVKA